MKRIETLFFRAVSWAVVFVAQAAADTPTARLRGARCGGGTHSTATAVWYGVAAGL